MTFYRFTRVVARLALIVALAFPQSSLALAAYQTTRATVSGTVTDEKGSVISNARVTAKNLDTGISREVRTDDEGRYSIPELSPGRFEVKAEFEGFRPEIRTGIDLTVGREAVLNFALAVGGAQEQVVIEGNPPLVETTSSTVGFLVDNKQIEELPLNGRDVLQLATLQNGVVSTTSIGVAQDDTGPGTTKLVINGARLDANGFYLDGTETVDAFGFSPGGLGGGFLGVDALREFQVLTSNYSAEFGLGGGAIINAVTKSGTNEFHGTAFEFLRNDVLDARNFFNAEQLPFKRNQFGGSLGGPIRPNRTFFFFTYEGLRRREGTSTIFNVPSPAAREGRLTTGTVTVAERVKPYLALYPLPNGPISGDTGVYRRDFNESTNEDFLMGRIDHKLSGKHSVFGRYTFDDSDLRKVSSVILDQVLTSRNQYLTLEEQAIFTPNALNSVRFGFSRTNFASDFPFIVPVAPELSFVPGQPMGAFSLQGISELRPSLAAPRSFVLNTFEVNDQFIYNRGAHSLKIGGLVRRYQLNADSALVPYGVYVYGGGLRPFLTGTPFVLFVPFPGTDFYRGIRQSLFGLYVQDDWKVRPNLTLNLGLRYEPISTPTEANDRVSNLRNFTDEAPTVGDPFFENPSKKNFGPRVGFAWDPSGDGRWAIRGGAGIFYAAIRPMQYRFAISNQPPFTRLVVLPGINFATGESFFPDSYRLFINSPLPFPGLLWFMQHDADQPTVYQWNFNVQRQLGRDLVVMAGYVGSRGVHLLTNATSNVRTDFQIVNGRKFYPDIGGGTQLARVNPRFGAMQLLAFNGDSYYHGLQLSATKRYSAGLQFQAAYTYAKSIDVGSATESVFANGATGGDFQDPLAPALDKALSDFDHRHNFIANFLWELPFGKGRAVGSDLSGFADKLVSGWSMGGILNLRSGFPFTVSLGFDRARNGVDNVQSQRPDVAPGRDLKDAITGDPNRYVDPTAFRLQPAGFYGDLGRNALTGPDLRVFDFSLIKETS
ncbi:MAG TPA: TonB-dependent receptor, partial [Blastocatellia bacterium]|nr:TonB-dependent receptor [Blastocatellia bacterium]